MGHRIIFFNLECVHENDLHQFVHFKHFREINIGEG